MGDKHWHVGGGNVVRRYQMRSAGLPKKVRLTSEMVLDC